MVKVNGEESDPIPVTSGVPQGTVLAGTLFICMMKTINENVTHSKVSSYADYTKFLQGAIPKVIAFQVLRYGCTKDSNDPEYNAPNGASISVREHVKDLRVWMSSKGTFEYHINDVVQRASNMPGWMLNCNDYSLQDHIPDKIRLLFTSLSPKILEFL